MVNRIPRSDFTIDFDLYTSSEPDFNYGGHVNKLEAKAMLNGGYIIKIELVDILYGLLAEMVQKGYFRSKSELMQIRFRIRSTRENKEESMTKYQIANVLSIRGMDAEKSNTGKIEIIAIDPASWYLNIGNSSGKAYTGRMSDVIRQVINEYAPTLRVDVGRTIDSPSNKWYMMRQDPRTFISSMLEWSSSITPKKTNWIISSETGVNFGDDGIIIIKEQADYNSRQRGFYSHWGGDISNLLEWELLGNNALSIVQTKIATHGVSAVAGEYYDGVIDNNETIIYAKDSNTDQKLIAKTRDWQSPKKATDVGNKTTTVGWTSIETIPEFNDGSLGIPYRDYISGSARNMYLALVNAHMKARFTVVGHGEWSSPMGLGYDTIFIKWLQTARKEPQEPYFMSGNWLVYGFHHKASSVRWTTDIYASRYDYDALAQKVG